MDRVSLWVESVDRSSGFFVVDVSRVDLEDGAEIAMVLRGLGEVALTLEAFFRCGLLS